MAPRSRIALLALVAATAADGVPARLRGAAVELGGKMECGDKVGLCGVIAVSSGLGGGNYKHDTPSVHGLWPEVGSYGNSQCIKPTGSTADPTGVVSCYKDTGGEESHIVQFEQHEWDKHGQCAGAVDATGFLTTVCDLAAKPLAIMAATRTAGGDLTAMGAAISKAGYEIFSTDPANSQLMLSACASSDKTWKLALVADFPTACGDWPADAIPTRNDTGSCAPAVRGPACEADADCASSPGCKRCASSGYCTDIVVA